MRKIYIYIYYIFHSRSRHTPHKFRNNICCCSMNDELFFNDFCSVLCFFCLFLKLRFVNKVCKGREWIIIVAPAKSATLSDTHIFFVPPFCPLVIINLLYYLFCFLNCFSCKKIINWTNLLLSFWYVSIHFLTLNSIKDKLISRCPYVFSYIHKFDILNIL